VPHRSILSLLAALAVVATMSATLVVPVHAAPAAPVITTVTPGPGSMTLEWDPVAGATSYQLTVDSGTATTVTSPTNVTGLNNGQSYSFVIIAVDGSGSTPSAAVTERPGTPNAPTVTGVTFTDTTMSVSYIPPTVPNGTITDYEFYLDGVRRPNASQTYTAPYPNPLVISTSGPVTGSYTLRMGANNGTGLGVFTTYTSTSGASSGAPPVLPPAVPTITVTDVTGTSFRYALSSSGSLDALYLQVGAGEPRGMNPNDNTGIVADLDPDTSYVVTAWATRGELTSPRTSIVVRTQSVPQPVTGLTLTQAPGYRAVATWGPPPGRTAVTSYRVEMTADGVAVPCVGRTDPATASCVSPSLRVGSRVLAKVTPVGEFGDGPWTMIGETIRPERPAPPQVFLDPTNRGLFVTVRRTDLGGASGLSTSIKVTGSGGSPLEVQRSSACPQRLSIDGCFLVSLRNTNTRGMVILAQVRTSGGTSDYTRVEASLVEGEDVLPAPTNVVAKPGGGFVSITWDAPFSPAPVRGYVVVDAAGVQMCEVGGSVLGCTFPTVDGVRQTYRVRAFNASGDGDLSAPTAVVASGVPTQPTVTSAERLTSTTARIAWTASTPIGTADVTEYVIRLADDAVLCRVPATERTCDVTVPSTPVRLTLSAISEAGPSSPISIDLTQPLLPLPPSGLRFTVEASPGNGTAVLVAQWNAVTGDPVPTSYRVVAQGNSAVGCTVTAPATRCIISGATPGATTAFTVSSSIGGRYGKESEPVSAALDKPSSAGLRRAIQSGATSIEATWRAPEGSPSIDRIEARVPSGQSCTSATGSLTCTITGLAPKTKQRVEMRAINAFGATDWLTRTNLFNDYWGERLPSGGADVWMRTLPQAPDKVWVTYRDGELWANWNSEDIFKIRDRDLRWDRPAGYRVFLVSNPSIGRFWAPASGAEETEEQVCANHWSSCEVKVPNDVPYLFRIVAYNEMGESESVYTPISIATRDRQAPGAPSAVKVTRTGLDTMRITWTATPRSAWGSNLPPMYGVRVGESMLCQTYATSCIVGDDHFWRYPILWGQYQEGELPVSVNAFNNAGDSPLVTTVVPAYRP
jgi:hypothetical protein